MKNIYPLFITVWTLCSCTDITGSDPDMELIFTSSTLSGQMAGDQPTSGEEIIGGFEGGLFMAGNSVGGLLDSSVGGELGLSPIAVNEGTSTDPQQCGENYCDSNAVCITSESDSICECNAFYEGDGMSCSPIPCPINASGAPQCICDDGFEGDLFFELSSKQWQGECFPTNPCELIVIREDRFIETDNRRLGNTIYESCLRNGVSFDYDRYSFEAGKVYHYYETSESNDSCDPNVIGNEQQDFVEMWPYSGGVLIDPSLFRVRDLSYSFEECTFDLLGTMNRSTLKLIYLVPSGQSCNDGDVQAITCGIGACQASGELRCDNGEWLEDCTPITALNGPDLCDGLDSDCDDRIDEDFVAEESLCGLGLCASTGIISCIDGQEVDACSPELSTGVDDNCDGLDQDCDGRSDEAFLTQTITCGQGACRADGVILCEEGVELTVCTPEVAFGTDSNCNSVDEDCDGQSDEGYIGQAVSCGTGACLFDGFTRCINGEAEDSCTPLEPAGDDANCNGIDDDCDGQIDEDFVSRVTLCGTGACVNSGETRCVDGEEQDLCVPLAPLGEDRECDSIDTDCDGRIDEGFVSVLMPCSGAGVYECQVNAALECNDGEASFDCASVLSDLDDASCDGLDDDCDGQLDENYVSIEIQCGQGVCADTSMSRCINGEVTDRCVVRSPTGDDSDCDGQDDDCDGLLDESFIEQVVSCGEGVCASSGLARCIDGQYQSDCQATISEDKDESTCDNLDNDCDGRVDEAYASYRNECGFGVCRAVGSSSCNDGVELMNCNPLLPIGDDADCDGIDQDCDDQNDESYPPVIDTCGTGVCYNTANSSCVDGEVQNNCVPLPEQGDDSRCDGIDQDCDGNVDEAYQAIPTTCTYGSVCVQDGLTACVNGQVQDVCDPPFFYTGSDNSCDNQDNDCDGSIDESFVGGIYYCGSGICQSSGFRSCINGQEGGGNCTPNNHLSTSDANCNGSDDDCDGRSDEHYGTYNVNCGRGVCQRSGVESCSAGSLVSTCSPGNPLGDDTDTNGQDDDCDGQIDEDACSFVSNTDGCNGNDDDCDGRVDEDFSSYNDTCGQGACFNSGQVTCNNGNEVSSCSPNLHLSTSDDDCNSVDNDCDGRFDEHYQGAFEICGVGACKSNGYYICQNGSPVHDCSPGQPGEEISGNGIDDDCDGQADESIPPPPPLCGNFVWYISPGRGSLNEFCCVDSNNCNSWAVYTSVMQPGNQASSPQDQIVCKDGQPYPGRGSYHIASRGPYYYLGSGDFTYWQITPTGTVVDTGSWNCAGPGGGGSF